MINKSHKIEYKKLYNKLKSHPINQWIIDKGWQWFPHQIQILKSIENYEPISMCEVLNSVKSFTYLNRNYKNLKKGNVILDLIKGRLMRFFWDYQCGFSMYESYSGSKVYGFRTSTGLRESDIQATSLGVWCCKLIDQIATGKGFKITT